MVSPIIPDLAVAPLRAMQEKGLRHRATVRRSVTIRLPNGEEETNPVVVGEQVPVLLLPLGPKDAELAAARGIQAGFIVKRKLREDLRPADALTVTGLVQGVAFTEDVTLTGDLSSPGRVVGRMAAVRTALIAGR
jgi:hypothetical protein